MKLMFIIFVMNIIQNSYGMDYRNALVNDRATHSKQSASRLISKQRPKPNSDETEETKIIDFLREKQSRPRQILPSLDTQAVNKEINEKWVRNNGYLSKTEIALSLDTPPARQWLVDACQQDTGHHEAIQVLINLINNNETTNVQKLLQWTATDSCGNSFLVRYHHPTIKPFSFTDLTFKNPAMLSLVLAAGSNLDVPDINGNTPLHRASMAQDKEATRILLSYGAPTDTPNELGETPLHIACTGGSFEVVSALLKRGANANAINPQSDQFETPLLCALKACQHNSNKRQFFLIIKKLISKTTQPKRADYTQLNDQGISAQHVVHLLPDHHPVYKQLKGLIPPYDTRY